MKFVSIMIIEGFYEKSMGLEEKLAGGEFALEMEKLSDIMKATLLYRRSKERIRIALGYPVYVTEIQKDNNSWFWGLLMNSRDGIMLKI